MNGIETTPCSRTRIGQKYRSLSRSLSVSRLLSEKAPRRYYFAPKPDTIIERVFCRPSNCVDKDISYSRSRRRNNRLGGAHFPVDRRRSAEIGYFEWTREFTANYSKISERVYSLRSAKAGESRPTRRESARLGLVQDGLGGYVSVRVCEANVRLVSSIDSRSGSPSLSRLRREAAGENCSSNPSCQMARRPML